MKRVVVTATLMGFLIFPAIANDPRDKELELQASFKQADVIADEKIDVGEFDIYNLKIFEAMDENDDRILVSDECFSGCFPTFNDEISSQNSVIHYRFEIIDEDKNDEISQTEFINYGRRQFKDYDGNEDKLLSREEFYAFYAALNERTFMAKTLQKAE